MAAVLRRGLDLSKCARGVVSAHARTLPAGRTVPIVGATAARAGRQLASASISEMALYLYVDE
jgi:hypothetical protein